jgi:hypothetical protein
VHNNIAIITLIEVVGTTDLLLKTFLHTKGLKSHRIHQSRHTVMYIHGGRGEG